MTDETSPVPMRTPSHGQGQLQVGNPGNRGGMKGRSGRKPDAFRKLARRLISERKLMHRMADIAEAKIGEIKTVLDAQGETLKQYTETPIREQRGAIAELLRVGVPLLKEASTEDVKKRLASNLERIRKFLPHDQAEALIKELEQDWL